MVDEKEKDSTEQKIIAAAKQVFHEKGLDGARMQDIADKAGINKALLHYYFRSKDKLFEMIFREAVARLIPKVGILFLEDVPLFEKIEKFVDFYIAMLIENPYLPLFVMNEIQKESGREFLEGIFNGKKPAVHVLAKQIEEEVAKGNIKPIKPMQLTMNMVSMCIFPFMGRPMIKLLWDINEEQFMQAMEERKKHVVQFIIDSIRK
ncbi:TetR/AcrR family transcriptional regulator [Pseudoflavitalea sp. G-6-1-2]|uniref:TetR/AcrR family transcriptional regulator n=1 Tax=Pseudoflavitalea sp. G-6-1-2 TaxID=2728841 RepID=UPI00146A8F94|nr:TetR/AcrR family transcriptional regulator [Pseudoflavitalea sp. G-6-1-2]NML23260.1 TetR/AcrR family transcriptional regulator [Pseudoflavitalea sp. G-6-1-2]